MRTALLKALTIAGFLTTSITINHSATAAEKSSKLMAQALYIQSPKLLLRSFKKHRKSK